MRNPATITQGQAVGPTPVLSSTTSRAISKAPTPAEALDEDLGSALARTTTIRPQEDIPLAVASIPTTAELPWPDPDEEERIDITTFSLSSELEVGRTTRKLIGRVVCTYSSLIDTSASDAGHITDPIAPSPVSNVTSVSGAANTGAAAKRKNGDTGAPSVKPVKKKKKKRNEIDDIFGF